MSPGLKKDRVEAAIMDPRELPLRLSTARPRMDDMVGDGRVSVIGSAGGQDGASAIAKGQ